MEIGERHKGNSLVALLDWEKAFDKVNQKMLLKALRMMGTPQVLISTVANIYAEQRFRVKGHGGESQWRKQRCGIKQGCPMSPYLFIILMSCVRRDVEFVLARHGIRVEAVCEGLDSPILLYADDTAIISRSHTDLEIILRVIEDCAGAYGLKLNRSKCILLTKGAAPSVRFLDNSEMPKAPDAPYLGCVLTDNLDAQREINRRLGEAYATLGRLQYFWSRANAPKAWKIQVLQAVIKSKVTYAMDSIRLSPAMEAKINHLQIRALRKITGLASSFVCRENTNEKVINAANDILRAAKKKATVRAWSADIRRSRMRLLGHVLRAETADPIRSCFLEEETINELQIGTWRVGRPRKHWLEQAVAEAWAEITGQSENDFDNTPLQQELVISAALARAPPFGDGA